MNGISLLLALASLNVVYSWRTGVDQQAEYVLQIEPDIVQALISGGPRGEGEEIFSDIPANAGPFARICISILPKDSPAARHTAAAEDQFRQLLLSGRYASRGPLPAADAPAILWPARPGALPEQSLGVTTGWQPDSAGNQQYIVQIDPSVLSTLAIGDEIYAPVDPAAGRPVRFIVKAGRGALPRPGATSTVGSQPPLQPIGGTNPTGAWANSTAPDLIRERPRNSYTDLPGGGPRRDQYTTTQPIPPQQPPVGYGNPPVENYEPYRTPVNPADMPPGGYVQPVGGQQSQWQQQRQWNNQYPEARVAGLQPTNLGPMVNTPLNNNGFPITNPLQPPQDKPWGPLLFVTFALFFSIGGNLYLAYTALEFHSRYRSAIERLRSAARST
jgi:hypothetical protein